MLVRLWPPPVVDSVSAGLEPVCAAGSHSQTSWDLQISNQKTPKENYYHWEENKLL